MRRRSVRSESRTISAREVDNTTSDAGAAIWFPYHIASPHAERWAEEKRAAFVALMDDPESGVSMVDFDMFAERSADRHGDVPSLGAPLVIAGRSCSARSSGRIASLDCDVIVAVEWAGERQAQFHVELEILMEDR